MKPIEGWEDATPIIGAGFPTLPPGAYVCRVVTAREELSKSSQKRMLVLAIDIAEGDQKDFFLTQYESRQKSNDKATWGAGGIYRQVVEGDSIGRFKGMIEAFKMSNPGYEWNWDEKTLRGKRIGGVFREEEYLGQDNKVKTSIKCISLIPVGDVEKTPVPEKKTLEPSEFAMAQNYISDSDIPF